MMITPQENSPGDTIVLFVQEEHGSLKVRTTLIRLDWVSLGQVRLGKG